MTTRSTRLLLINTLVASFLLVDPWVGVLIFDPARGARALGPVLQVVVRGGMLLLETGLVMLFLLALTYLELLGVRFFARQRSWRLTPEASWQVVCHASAGWIVFGLLPLLGMAALYAMVRGFRYVPQGTIDLTAYVPTLPAISVHSLVTGLLTLGGALLGLLVFETLVFIGVRRCKFATTLRSEAPRPVANVPPRA